MKVQSPQIRMLLSYLILTGIYCRDVNFQFIMGGGKYICIKHCMNTIDKTNTNKSIKKRPFSPPPSPLKKLIHVTTSLVDVTITGVCFRGHQPVTKVRRER